MTITPDLVVIKRGSTQVEFLAGDGTGHFSNTRRLRPYWAHAVLGLAVEDVDGDGDGDQDVLVGSDQGLGGGQEVMSDDLDGDGQVDLVYATGDTFTILPNNLDGARTHEPPA